MAKYSPVDVMKEAKELSSALESQYAFFLGAGFSKNIKGMPDFKDLVRNRILPEFYDNFLGEGDGLKKEFLATSEFKPQNCVQCFINSYKAIHKDKYWFKKIASATLQGGCLSTLNDCINELKRLVKEEDHKEKDTLIPFLDEILTNPEESNVILLLEYTGSIWISEIDNCINCMNACWDKSRPKETSYLLGLLQFYLDKGNFQFTSLLEFIQTRKKKRMIAEYAFRNNPNFNNFGDLIDKYHKSPYRWLGDSQIVLARLAKEGLIHHVITTNWDDLIELACYAVDMYVKTSDGDVYGQVGEKLPRKRKDLGKILEYRHYVNNVVAISEKEDFYDSRKSFAPTKRTFYIYKIHGGIDAILKEVKKYDGRDIAVKRTGDTQDNSLQNQRDDFNVNLVITHRDLIDWRHDNWSEEHVNSILRSHDTIFAGISGQDTVVYGTIRKLMEELQAAYRDVGNDKCVNCAIWEKHKTDEASEAEESKIIKQVYSVNVQRELVLSNMLWSEPQDLVIKSKLVEIERTVAYNGHEGTDLFYRWFYVYSILKNFEWNQKTYLRKVVEYLNNGESDYEIFEGYQGRIKIFFEEIFELVDDNLLNLKSQFCDIVYDVIPKSLIYTWLINNELSSIIAETGGTNFLVKKPHFYLPVFAYHKWFSMFLLMFATLYKFLKEKADGKNITVTEDGVIIIDEVAMIFVVGKANANWKNLQRALVLKFSHHTNKLLNCCRKKVILKWTVTKENASKDKDLGKMFFISRFFECYQIDLDNMSNLLGEILDLDRGKQNC